MPKNEEYMHHQPRKADKKKKQRFNEDAPEKRVSRINFKNYIRQLEEEDAINADFEDSELE
jgi:hypothetical protein